MNAPVLNQYDPANAAAIVRLCARSYTESTINDPATDTHVLITGTDTDLFATFTGTRDFQNWLTDLDCAWDHLDHCKIHRGFARACDSVFDAVTQALFQAGYKSRRLWLGGHSLGGALAMYFAWKYFTQFHEIPFSGIYTFGQPRVGDATFRDQYNFSGLKQRTFRVIHADDIIPRVPWLLGSYRHAGHEVFYGDNIAVGRCCCDATDSGGDAAPHYHQPQPMIDSSIWQKLPFDVRNAWRELTQEKIALVADHHVSTYLGLFTTDGTDATDKNQSEIPSAQSVKSVVNPPVPAA